MITTLQNHQQILEKLQDGELTFPPVELRLCPPEVLSNTSANVRNEVDGVLQIDWQGRSARFAIECKVQDTQQTLVLAIAQAQSAGRSLQMHPLVIVPYLSEASLHILQDAGVSGIDLSGNGVLITPEMALWRSGRPRRFRSPQPNRNVYRGVSSLITRSFLLRPAFASLQELQIFAQERLAQGSTNSVRATLTKGTVSKVVQVLAEERVILKEGRSIRILSIRTLLDALKANSPKSNGLRIQGKMPLATAEAWNKLRTGGLRCVTTGNGSAGYYRVLSGSDKLSLYVDDLAKAQALLDLKLGPLFPNVELIEERGDVVYFDTRDDGHTRWASPVQTWLEMSLGGPREREAASVLEQALLRGDRVQIP